MRMAVLREMQEDGMMIIRILSTERRLLAAYVHGGTGY